MKILLFNREISDNLINPDNLTLVADSALMHPGNPLFIPEFAPDYILDIMPAAIINRLGKTISRKFAPRYYSNITFLMRLVPVIDGKPVRNGSAMTTTFDNAIIQGKPFNLEALPDIFTIKCGELQFTINKSQLHFDQAIEIISRNMTLKIGDIIATSRLDRSIPAVIDSKIELSSDFTADDILKFRIK